MLALTTEQSDALAANQVMRRHFIWCDARDPDTGDPDPAGFWNDVGNVEIDGKIYNGSGTVVQIATLSAKGDLTIPGLSVTLSGVDVHPNVLARGRAISQAPIRVDIGLFNPTTRAILLPLFPLFVGFLDDCKVPTPEAGGNSTIEFICESTSRSLTTQRTGTRSSSTQQARAPTDNIYQYTAMQVDKPIYFGRKSPAGAGAPAAGGGLVGGPR